jgi:hypothetical protein
MSDDNEALNAWIETSAALLKLPIDPAWIPSIRDNLEVTYRLAALVEGFALPDEAEPAPVFEA